MRVRVVRVQQFELHVRGHGPEAVRRLERLTREDMLSGARVDETWTFETMRGDFSVDAAPPREDYRP